MNLIKVGGKLAQTNKRETQCTMKTWHFKITGSEDTAELVNPVTE